jgi:hypothetical protein
VALSAFDSLTRREREAHTTDAEKGRTNKGEVMTVQLTTDTGNATLTIALPLDATREQQNEASRLAAKCVRPGGQIRCDAPYVPSVDVFSIQVDRDSELGQVLWR